MYTCNDCGYDSGEHDLDDTGENGCAECGSDDLRHYGANGNYCDEDDNDNG